MASQAQSNLFEDEVFPVPPTEAFESAEHGFIPAPELQEIADRLIADYERFRHLFVPADADDEDSEPSSRVTLLWREKGGAPGGRRTLGKAQVATNLLGYFAGRTFVVWIAADHLRAMQYTPHQVEALIFNQLAHCGFDLKRGYVVVHPDVTFFYDEYRHYGAWRDSLKRAETVIKQPELFDSAAKIVRPGWTMTARIEGEGE